MTVEPVCIIGVGSDGITGLSQMLCEKIEAADELWGGERLLNQVPDREAKKIILGSHLATALQQLRLRSSKQKVVILASGDPGFYGIAASVLKVLPSDEVLVYPQVSSLQTAFARIRLPWQDAALTSAHARAVTEVIGLARRFPKIGILTDPLQTPAWISTQLLAAGIPDCRAVVCENLGEADEKIIDTRLVELAGKSFAPLNVLLLIHDQGWKPVTLTNRPDSAYRHKNGLITKRDVRIMSIARLAVCETDVIWDIGAGSGAVSIEIAEAAWRGQVLAIEKDEECLACLHENVTRYGVTNVQIVEGEAPQVLEKLPVPSAIFIGGSSGKLADILNWIEKIARPECRVVGNFAVLENLLLGFDWMRVHGCNPEITVVQFSYGLPIGEGTRLVPSNPVFILGGMVHGKREIE